MTIWAAVRSALAGLGLSVETNRRITQSGEDLPDRFLSFQEIAAVPEEHVDDHEIVRAHLVQINLWSRDGFENFPDVEAAMKAAGFLFQAERDMEYDKETGHFGQSKDFLLWEEKE